MEERLHQRVVGQDEAVAAVSNAVRRSSGIRPEPPDWLFIFLCPTGVGKTELARALAEFLFDDKTPWVGGYERISGADTINAFGAPRLRRLRRRRLTEAVRRRPYSVVLFDK